MQGNIERIPPLAEDAWVSERTVAQRLDICERQVRNLIRSGAFEARTLTRRCVRIRWSSVLAYVEKASTTPPPKRGEKEAG
jgi:hypothetical protein